MKDESGAATLAGMAVPDTTVHIASINTRHATELAIRSARALADREIIIKVGDCGSTDGSLSMLRQFERRGWIQLEVAMQGRRHPEWLDLWVQGCATPWALFLDSDVEVRRRGWLNDMHAQAAASGAVCIGGEGTPDAPNGRTAAGEHVHVIGCQVAPWIMLCRVDALRDVDTSFAEVRQPREGQPPLYYDVAGWQQVELVNGGYECLVMPESFRSAYMHFRGLSWRRDPGVKARCRFVLRYSNLYARLLLRRALDARNGGH